MTAPQDRAGVVRVMALAAHAHWESNLPPGYRVSWAQRGEESQAQILALQSAVLAALEAAGLREWLRAVFDAGCAQGRDEALSEDWGTHPIMTREQAFTHALAASPFAPPQQGDGT